MSNWFYSRAGSRLGPYTDVEMRNLARSGQILADTLCWRREFGADWKPFSQTELSTPSYIDSNQPPPLPVALVSNEYAWLYAAIPLIGAVIERIVVQNSGIADIPVAAYWIAYPIAYGMLAALDSRTIARAGHAKVPNPWWFLLAPAYLLGPSARARAPADLLMGLGLGLHSGRCHQRARPAAGLPEPVLGHWPPTMRQ